MQELKEILEKIERPKENELVPAWWIRKNILSFVDQTLAKLKEIDPTAKCADCVYLRAYLEADGEIVNMYIEKEVALEKIIDQLKAQHEEDENIYKQVAEHNDILIAENKKLIEGQKG